MKKRVFLFLIGIGVLLFVAGIVFVVPWFIDLFQEFEQMSAKQVEYKRALREYANAPLTEEQEILLSQLLEIIGETSDAENSQSLEGVLSSDAYLAYLKTQDEQDYADFPAYVAAMPSQHHRNVVQSRLKGFLEEDIDMADQEIWLDFYYIIRDWSKTGKNQQNKGKEFKELLQKELVDPIMKDGVGSGGFTTLIVKMGIVSAIMTEDTEMFHKAWDRRFQNYGTQKGYLRCAIATPDEFALMRSFFEDAAAFETWIAEPFKIEETDEKTEENVE